MRSIRFKDRFAYNALFLAHHLAPKSEYLQKKRDDVRMRIVDELARGGKGKVIPVERVDHLTPEEFRRKYLATGTPVIIANGARDWPCVRNWSFESFRERFGSASLKLVHHKGLAEPAENVEREYTEELNFGDFLDQALKGSTKYMRFSPILEMFPELIDDFDMKFLREMPGRMNLGTTFEAFVGGKKSFTPLHNAPTPFFFVNACGVKRWALIPNHYLPILDPAPDGMSYNHSGADVQNMDLERYPGLDCIDRMEAVLHPGDLYFMPSWLWHSVENESPTIGVRCGFIYPKSMFTEAKTLCFIRTFAARNPNLLQVLYYTLFSRDLPDREHMLLQPKMYWNLAPMQAITESRLARKLFGSKRLADGTDRS